MAATSKEEKTTAPLMPVVQPAPLMPAVQPAAVQFAEVQQINRLGIAQAVWALRVLSALLVSGVGAYRGYIGEKVIVYYSNTDLCPLYYVLYVLLFIYYNTYFLLRNPDRKPNSSSSSSSKYAILTASLHSQKKNSVYDPRSALAVGYLASLTSVRRAGRPS